MCGTYKKNLISTISFYVVLIPYGIGDVVLISLTMKTIKDNSGYACSQETKLVVYSTYR